MIEQIPDRIDSKFRFVLLAAQRAEQLMRGARPKVENSGRKPTVAAMKEIEKEAIDWDYGPEQSAAVTMDEGAERAE